jgi:hypothetical protein
MYIYFTEKQKCKYALFFSKYREFANVLYAIQNLCTTYSETKEAMMGWVYSKDGVTKNEIGILVEKSLGKHPLSRLRR